MNELSDCVTIYGIHPVVVETSMSVFEASYKQVSLYVYVHRTVSVKLKTIVA